MLRSTLTRPTRLWLSVAARCESTGTGQQVPPALTSDPTGPFKAKKEKSKLAESSQTPEATAAEDKVLEDALLKAFQQIEQEQATPAPTKVEGYDGPVFNAALHPNAKYNPADLPLQQENSRYHQVSEEEWSATLIRGRSVQEPIYHKPIYNIPVANVHFRSYQQKRLDFFCHFASHAAASLGIPISKVAHLPTQRSMWTVPRSPFAHKKSQENFERKTHKRAVKAWDADPVVVERWLQYLRKHQMAGVGVKVTKWTRLPLGLGALTRATKADLAAKVLPKDQVKNLAAKILQKEAPASAAAPVL